MSELKTLEVIIDNLTDWNSPRFFEDNITPDEVKKKIKEEAIKWVKEDRILIENNMPCKNIIYLRWIKRFNITEEDLLPKETKEGFFIPK